jgi:hypothetical protein
LLGADVRRGERTDLNMRVEVEASSMTVSRWRTIARNWDVLWPILRDAKSRAAVTQAALLRRCDPATDERVTLTLSAPRSDVERWRRKASSRPLNEIVRELLDAWAGDCSASC